jgi:hypothetical protein
MQYRVAAAIYKKVIRAAATFEAVLKPRFVQFVDYGVNGSRNGTVRLFADYTWCFSTDSVPVRQGDEFGVWSSYFGDLKIFDHWLSTDDNGKTYYSYQIKMSRKTGNWDTAFLNSHPNIVAASKAAYAAVKLNSRNDELLRLMPLNAVTAEFGVQAGVYSQYIASVSHPRELHLVDVWEETDSPWPSYEEQKQNHLNVLNMFGTEVARGSVIVHKGDDLDYMERFFDHYFDWVYLDTTHQYEHTLRELELAARKVKPDGYICGHDYTDNEHSRKWGFGVIRAVNEFTRKHDWSIAYITQDVPSSYVLKRTVKKTTDIR